jgi:hypothetical protein
MAPRGVYRERNGWGNQHSVRVDYDPEQMEISEEKYRADGYQPPFENLPWKGERPDVKSVPRGTLLFVDFIAKEPDKWPAAARVYSSHSLAETIELAKASLGTAFPWATRFEISNADGEILHKSSEDKSARF